MLACSIPSPPCLFRSLKSHWQTDHSQANWQVGVWSADVRFIVLFPQRPGNGPALMPGQLYYGSLAPCSWFHYEHLSPQGRKEGGESPSFSVYIRVLCDPVETKSRNATVLAAEGYSIWAINRRHLRDSGNLVPAFVSRVSDSFTAFSSSRTSPQGSSSRHSEQSEEF